MIQIEDAINKAKEATKVAELFAIKYSAKLPDGLGNFATGSYGTTFNIYLKGRDEEDRQRALLILGDVFGRAGWIATPAYSNDGFHWGQKIDNVQVDITYAQEVNTPKTFPVAPNQFPIQIENN